MKYKKLIQQRQRHGPFSYRGETPLNAMRPMVMADDAGSTEYSILSDALFEELEKAVAER